jgi:catechol 2,3-dioxygenase-like lactoylglutathione lyase family enzyme
MLKLDHVVFTVRDAAATMRFYRERLGLPLVDAISGPDWGGYSWLMMIFGLSGAHEISCVALRGAHQPDYAHLPRDSRHYALAAESAAAIESWRKRLRSAGVEFWEETHGDRQSIYFPDPDGVILEITWPPSQPRTQDKTAAIEAVSTWLAEQS